MSDWRNAEDYAYCEGLTLHGWAWEFLRRSGRYRHCWQDFSKLRQRALIGRVRLESVQRYALDVAASFGLGWPVDPAENALTADYLWMDGAGVKLLWGVTPPPEAEPPRPWPGFPGALYLAFNLTEPVEPQVEQTRHLLELYQGQLVRDGMKRPRVVNARAQRDKYALYVRVLDADADGASLAKIGAVLYPEAPDPRDQAMKARKAARKLASHGFRRLLHKANI